MSNTNKMGNEGYYAEFEAWKEKKCVACFGMNINENHGNVFSVKLAEELLETGNKIYKENFGKDANFNVVKYDMTDYWIDKEHVLDDGVSNPTSYKTKKIGVYKKQDKLLRIYIDGTLVYENKDGKICRDSVALCDSDTDNI